MKRALNWVLIGIGCLLGVFPCAMAQASAALDIVAQRQRVAQQRQAHDGVFVQAQRLCYSRFAVSDCLRRARADHRVAFDELRRQEIVLNDLDRKNKAVATIKRIETNVSGQEIAPGCARP